MPDSPVLVSVRSERSLARSETTSRENENEERTFDENEERSDKYIFKHRRFAPRNSLSALLRFYC